MSRPPPTRISQGGSLRRELRCSRTDEVGLVSLRRVNRLRRRRAAYGDDLQDLAIGERVFVCPCQLGGHNRQGAGLPSAYHLGTLVNPSTRRACTLIGREVEFIEAGGAPLAAIT